jgi:hypothetical protein
MAPSWAYSSSFFLPAFRLLPRQFENFFQAYLFVEKRSQRHTVCRIVREVSAGARKLGRGLCGGSEAAALPEPVMPVANGLDAGESTAEAAGDWHYWVAQGYCF